MSEAHSDSGDGASTPAAVRQRQRWLGVLAAADTASLETAWSQLDPIPRFQALRGPEVGLAMLRGRAGGTGRRFNLGEMTVTRCAVRLDDGTLGVGYVAGRRPRHAELVALFDALMQDPTRRPRLDADVIAPAERAQREARQRAGAKTAETRVEFFTMVRGD